MAASRPSVSACIAVYNGAADLRRAIRSILDQTVPPDEVLVLDDGSTDNSAEVAREFEGVRVLTQKNAGIGAARRVLVENARCEWIAFCDHDDWWALNKLEQLLPYAAEPDVDLIYSGGYFHDEAGNTSKAPLAVPPDAPALRHLLPDHGNILMPTTLMRRSALLAIGNYQNLRCGEDAVAYFMLISSGRLVQVPEWLAYVCKRRNSASAPRRETYEYELAIYTDHLLPNLDKWYGALPAAELKWARAVIRTKVAHLESVLAAWYDLEGNHREALRHYRKSFRTVPISKGNLYRFLRSLLGLRVVPPGSR